jgi:outer membrane receptor protein involved in Fe transport
MQKILISFILGIGSFLYSQSGIISGTVTDISNGSPLIGANVVIENTIQGAATDSEGLYTIKKVTSGEQTLMVSYIGYKTLKKTVIVSTSGELIEDLEMTPELIEMETYVVTASRRRERVEDAPAAISVISKAEIRRESNANVGDYIKGTKGIDFTQSGIDSYNMTARGFNSSFSSRLLTLMDGRMANVPSLRLTAYNVIPVSFDDIEQIEVVLGPSSALYGPNAHSGVLNIVTSSPLRSQGTSVNIQGGLLSQTDTELLKKMSFRTAHKIGNFGFKLSGVALSGQDWTHYNPDEYEGHDPIFLGRPNLTKDNIDFGGSFPEPTSLEPIFSEEMLQVVEGADPSWVGKYWGDGMSNNGESGSPIITQAMIDEANESQDPFSRLTVDGFTLWYVTQEKLGWEYKDGIDNDGDGVIDDGIDYGIDDYTEIYFDGIDNDGDGLIDEGDERGSRWLNRIGSYKVSGILSSQYNIAGQDTALIVIDSSSGYGFGDYVYDSNGNIVFDSNDNDIFDDNLGVDGIDNDGDWGPFVDEYYNVYWVSSEPLTDLNGNGEYDPEIGETYIDEDIGYGIIIPVLQDFGLDGIPDTGDYGEGNGEWDGETYDDLNYDGDFDIYRDNDVGLDGLSNTGDEGEGDGLASKGEHNVDEIGEGDFKMNYGNLSNIYPDANNDGINDFPDFKVRNLRYDFRMDYEPNSDFSAVFSHGYAWARNINITGIARYMADGWIYRYYQGRLRWKNLFFQSYLNTSYSGTPERPTRNLATGSTIFDRSRKFSSQLQHVNEWKNGDLRFVWGMDYFLTMPDTRGTILRDKNGSDKIDNNGDGEAGSPYRYIDSDGNGYVSTNDSYSQWSTSNGSQSGNPLDSLTLGADGQTIYDDAVNGAIADGLDNDGDSDDFSDNNANGIPDYSDENENGQYDYGETLESGVRWQGGQSFIVYANGLDDDGDGEIDENIDEGIDEVSEDNRYTVNEFGAYYQLNWKINSKWEFIQATRLDAHDRLTDLIQFNNQNYGAGYNPFDWKFNFDKTDGLQVSPKIGIVYRPKQNQNFRLTWATAFNTPSNQALFLDIFITRVAIFKVYARGASGGYVFPRDSLNNPYYYDITSFDYEPVDTSQFICFYPSTDPRISGFYSQSVMDLPEIEAETVKSWEFGYKGRINQLMFGTLDLYTSHYSSFVSPATFITPIIIEKSVLETDYNGDGIINSITDIDNEEIADEDDYDESFNHWRDGIIGVTAADTTENSPPVVVGYVNYGEVDMWGLDASLTYFLGFEWNLGLTYSHLGMTDFYNPITKNKDPINAPRHKGSMKLQYNPRRWPFTGSLNARYVGGFNWSSGIYYGEIKPYAIYDLHAGYQITENVKFNITLNNLFNFQHTEIIGGPRLGRVALARLTTTF